MVRRGGTALVALGAITVLGGCRDHTVDLRFRPATGTTYEYRYEIEATLSRSLDGEEPEVTELDTVLLVDQTILTADADGARVEVELRRDDGPATTAMVVLDRAGSLQAVEAVEGLAADAFGASGQSLFGSAPLALPKGRLAAGERWTLGDDERRTTGRLERFGVIDGEKVAVVRSTASDDVQEAVATSGATAALDGAVSATSTTSYDLSDGAIRQSRTSSTGELMVEISPPAGIDAEPVTGTIAYEVRVRVERLD